MLEVKYKKISELTKYERNSRTHSSLQIDQIKNSINEFGFTNPILIDEHGLIIAGHGRLEAAKELSMQSVPTITLKGLSDAQKKAYVIADNKLALNAGWDDAMLESELRILQEVDYDLSLIGFDEKELDVIFDGEIDPNDLGEDFSLQDRQCMRPASQRWGRTNPCAPEFQNLVCQNCIAKQAKLKKVDILYFSRKIR